MSGIMGHIISHSGIHPEIAFDVFIADNACVIGNVHIGNGSSVWFGTVIRGDVNAIRIGKMTNIQDLSVVHVTTEHASRPAATVIGDKVTIGHKVILHGCTIEDGSLIGMGSIVMDHAVIGKGSIIGAGSLVTENTVIEPGHLAFGRPAKTVRPLTPEEIMALEFSARHYEELAKTYLHDRH